MTDSAVTNFDICYCGDYRIQHALGKGECLVCFGSHAPWERGGCKKFRLHEHSRGIPEAWRKGDES